MPIRDVAAMAKSLDNDYGTTAGSSAPASHELVLFFGDPMSEGVEVTEAGRATILPADWLPASVDAVKATDGLVTLADSTGAYTATHWALYGSDGNWWDCAELSEPLDVTGVGDPPTVLVEIFYDDSTQEG